MKKLLIGVAVIVVLAVGYYLLPGGAKKEDLVVTPTVKTEEGTPKDTSATTTDSSNKPVVVSPDSNGTVSVKMVLPALVALTDSGFSPSSTTIKKGDTVLFINKSSKKMWVASDPHPAHNGYSGTTLSEHCPDTAGVAFDQCSEDNAYSFTFEKVGTWGFHNHGTGDSGVIIVQ
ncbi:MAG: hypothetical protein PHS95_00685 [Candidatus Pacebacteria bacterium]|nr:hypothetical protein [Candidatus Paceibacterota bacterium]